MKIACIFLVMLNITYFLWQTRNQENFTHSPIDTTKPSLMLLSEMPRGELLNTTKTDHANEGVVTQASTEEGNCSVLSGFLDQSSAEQAAGLLSEHGIASKLNILEAQETSSYLVYLPPFQTREDAVSKLRELQANGIDSFIIAEGDRINGISLGVFAGEESAKRLQTQLKSKGYSSSVANSSRITLQHTLRIADHYEQELTPNLREEISNKYAGGKLTRVQLTCSE